MAVIIDVYGDGSLIVEGEVGEFVAVPLPPQFNYGLLGFTSEMLPWINLLAKVGLIYHADGQKEVLCRIDGSVKESPVASGLIEQLKTEKARSSILEGRVKELNMDVIRLSDMINEMPDTAKADHYEYMANIKDVEINKLRSQLWLATLGTPMVAVDAEVRDVLLWAKKLFITCTTGDWAQGVIDAIATTLDNKHKLIEDLHDRRIALINRVAEIAWERGASRAKWGDLDYKPSEQELLGVIIVAEQEIKNGLQVQGNN